MKKVVLVFLTILTAYTLFCSPVEAGTKKSNTKSYKTYSKSAQKKKTKKSSKSSGYKKSAVKKHSFKKSCVEWPDCDDYETEDDFLDDWDGNIPDGSDAEDYWDNW